MVYVIIGFVVGVVFGGACVGGFMAGHQKRLKVGKIRVDNSTGDLYLFMELEAPVGYVLDQKNIQLEVDLRPLTEPDTQE